MTEPHESVLYDVNDFKVAALLTDVTTDPTYDDIVDVGGVSAVTFDPTLITSELLGDATVIAKKGTIRSFKMSAQYGRLSLDATAVFMGGTVEDVAGPPAAATWTIEAANSLPYFQVQFQTLAGDVPDCHITGYKCQLTGGSLIDLSTNNFNQPKIDWDAIACISNPAKFVKIEFLEEETALA